MNLSSEINKTELQVVRLSSNAKIPAKQTNLSAGYDLYSPLTDEIPPHSHKIINLEIAIRLPIIDNFYTYGEIHPRSGLNFNYDIISTDGVIDFDYSGPICIKLVNNSDIPYKFLKHDRLAQLIIKPYISPFVVEVELLDPIENNTRNGGFGSTGR